MAIKPNNKWVIVPIMFDPKDQRDGWVCQNPNNSSEVLFFEEQEKAEKTARQLTAIAKLAGRDFTFRAERIVPGKPYTPIQATEAETLKARPMIFLRDPANRVPEADDDFGDDDTVGCHLKKPWFDDEKFKSLILSKNPDEAFAYAKDAHGVWQGKDEDGRYMVGIKNYEGKVHVVVKYETEKELHKEWILD